METTVAPQKLALLIGVNYTGTESALQGCIKDAQKDAEMLTAHCGYDRAFMTMMTDDTAVQPTHANIMQALLNLAKLTHEHESVTEVWFSYSGHGTSVRDDTGDEKDRRDEAIVPLDYKATYVITDDHLHSVLRLIRKGVGVFIKIDACNSGTCMDLRYRYVSGKKNVVENIKCDIQANVSMLSACKDNQTAADAFGLSRPSEYAGALTTALWHVVEAHGFVINVYTLLKFTLAYLREHGFTQVPQFCSAQPISRERLFMNCGSSRAVVDN